MNKSLILYSNIVSPHSRDGRLLLIHFQIICVILSTNKNHDGVVCYVGLVIGSVIVRMFLVDNVL